MRAQHALGLSWKDYQDMSEDVVMALQWEYDRMQTMALRQAGIGKASSSKELSRLRQSYLQVYWDIAHQYSS